jgi:hypothetical protein
MSTPLGDTAPISLLTGLPGAGKSLRIAQRISELVAKGEHVYHCNIPGLKIKGTTHWPDPKAWRDLPAGAILFVDEAQDFFPARRGGEPPEAVVMNRIRHEGIRIVLCTQKPAYLDAHLRGLVGCHEHLLRCNGKEASFIFRNNEVMDQVSLPIKRIKQMYDHETWTFPAQYFACYESAEVHAIKYRMPALLKKILVVGPLAIVLAGGTFGFLAWRGIDMQAKAGEKAETAPPASSERSPARSTAGSGGKVPRTAEEYVEAITPTVQDVPWSAPGFSGREFRSDPHVYCMATEVSCRCVTEQATRIPAGVVRDDVCRDIARWGEPYNPFKPPEQPKDVQKVEKPAEREALEPVLAGTAIGKATNQAKPFPEVPDYKASF